MEGLRYVFQEGGDTSIFVSPEILPNTVPIDFTEWLIFDMQSEQIAKVSDNNLTRNFKEF